MKKDYAKIDHMNAWLRHPVLGDPSFDTFERLGETVHVSAPPYEWAVNGSLFCDFDGTWYYYAGLYGRGYLGDLPSRFKIYRSKDKGESWEDLGWGMDTGFTFNGNEFPSDGCPDVFLIWDEKVGKYLLTYDTSTNDMTWEKAHDPNGHTADSGAAIAWADTPAGPFERVPERFLSNRKAFGMLGRWGRAYASCVVPRKNDYIAFCLCDSHQHYAWALSAMTAPTPDGPWSLPHLVLSCERPEYYPCPLEFFPVEVHGDKVLAHATSVAMNRNYQAVFEAELEAAHEAAAWKLTEDGNVWHAHDHPDEYVGIWGQTTNGFVEKETGRYIVMHASRNAQDLGTLGVAWRPWDTPHSDGFVFTAHGGSSISVLKAGYDAFDAAMEFTSKGTIDFVFDYHGILGPDDSCADSTPSCAALSNYTAVRVCSNACSIVTVSPAGNASTHGAGTPVEKQAAGLRICHTATVCPTVSLTTHTKAFFNTGITSLRIRRDEKGRVSVWANDVLVCVDLALPHPGHSSLALIAAPHSRLDCSRLEVEGEPLPYTWCWNTADAILGAGQLMPEKALVRPNGHLEADRWHRFAGGYVGEGHIAAKWNLHGSDFAIAFQKGRRFGAAGIWVDGCFAGSVELDGEGGAQYRVTELVPGPHAILVKPLRGRIAITGCVVKGPAAD